MLSYSGCPESRGISRAGLIFVIAAHALVVFALLQMKVLVMPAPLAVLNVSLLAPEAPPVPEPQTEPPQPRPIEKRPESRPRDVAPPAPPAPAVPLPPRFDADYLDNPKPVYPSLSRRLGEQGRVVLRVQVAASGLPTEVVLHASSGSPRLDQAAQETVRRWKFVPARLGGEAVAASVLVPIVFSLKD